MIVGIILGSFGKTLWPILSITWYRIALLETITKMLRYVLKFCGIVIRNTSHGAPTHHSCTRSGYCTFSLILYLSVVVPRNIFTIKQPSLLLDSVSLQRVLSIGYARWLYTAGRTTLQPVDSPGTR
jgi:hypothetical protein